MTADELVEELERVAFITELNGRLSGTGLTVEWSPDVFHALKFRIRLLNPFLAGEPMFTPSGMFCRLIQEKLEKYFDNLEIHYNNTGAIFWLTNYS